MQRALGQEHQSGDPLIVELRQEWCDSPTRDIAVADVSAEMAQCRGMWVLASLASDAFDLPFCR